MSHYDLRLPDCYSIDIDEMSRNVGVDEVVIQNIITNFSFSFGELLESKREFFLMDNPVWNKPIISLSSGYFCVLPQLFFSFVLKTLDQLVEKIDKLALHRQRAEYLEGKIEEIVKRRFPDSQVISGLKWDVDGTQFETDLIAFIDSHALIVEAKSHRISQQALRGAPDRIKRHLNDILISPGVQSYRLQEKLEQLRNEEFSEDSVAQGLPVDIKHIKKVLRISVSLDDFATLQTNLRLFEKLTGFNQVLCLARQ